MKATQFIAPRLWLDASSHNIPRDDIMNIIRSGQRLFPSEVTFSSGLNVVKHEIIPSKRIGSPSTEGEVYEISSHNITAALKILPILQDSDVEKNRKEIVIAREVSNLVIRGETQYFPIMYDWGQCDDIQFFHSSIFANQARYHAEMNSRRRLFPEKIKLLDRLEKVHTLIHTVDSQLNEREISLIANQGVKIAGDFMVSELADMDFKMWAERDHPMKEWVQIILDVLRGLRVLRSLGICHHDMHLGNILILSEQNGILGLIHDFGQATELTQELLTYDLIRFFDSLIQRVNVKIPLELETMLIPVSELN